jgi:hypothetical protein
MGITLANTDFDIHREHILTFKGRHDNLSEQIKFSCPHQISDAPIAVIEIIASHHNDGDAGGFSHQQTARGRNLIRYREHSGGQFFSVIVGFAT